MLDNAFINTKRTHQNSYAVSWMYIHVIMRSCIRHSIYTVGLARTVMRFASARIPTGQNPPHLRSIPRAVPPKPEPGWGRPWQSSFPVPATKSVSQLAAEMLTLKVPPQWVLTFPRLKRIRAFRLPFVFLYFLLPFLHLCFILPFLLSFGEVRKIEKRDC
jgi:hypothetical protein